MEYKEFREIMENCNNVVEVHEDDFKILCEFIIINDIVTLKNINTINLVQKKCLWFNNNNNIRLDDLKSLRIHEVRSYL